MDYNLIYNQLYDRDYLRFEKIIKNRLVKSKAQKLSFGNVFTEIRNQLSLYYTKKIGLLKDSKLDELYNIFQKRYNYFEVDEIDEIFKNKIERDFNKLVRDQNYTLNDLIKDIALLEIANEIGRLLQIHSTLFELFYKANDFEEFEIRVHGNFALESTPIYQKLRKKVYPEYYINDSNTSFDIKPFKLLKSNSENNSNGITASYNLSIDEKSFLFHVMCKALSEPNKINGDYNLPNTELLRLNSIIDFIDEKSFTKNYGDSTHYKILAKGLNYIPVNERSIFLHNLIENLENLQLKETTKYIKQILNTHINHLSIKK